MLEIFIIYVRFEQEGQNPTNPLLVKPQSIVPTRATNKVRKLNVLKVILGPAITDIGSWSSKLKIL